MTMIKPLQVVCSSASCRRRQTVKVDRVWFVDVRSGPGSHREAGWTCRFCGTENTTPPSHLPRGTISTLASRQQVQARLSGSGLDRSQTDPRRDGAIVGPDARAADAPPPSGSSRSATRAAKAAVVVIPVLEDALADDRASFDETDHAGAVGFLETGRPMPAWIVGPGARTVLTDALVRIARHGGAAVAIANRRSGFESVDVDLPDEDMDAARIERFAVDMLEALDEIRADLVVLGGDVGERPWQVVLHVTAGAASFV